MAFTPRQWLNFSARVQDLWRVFVSRYGGDTGAHTIGDGKWICADSGTAAEAVEAERLRAMSVANQPATLTGSPIILGANNLISRMGRRSGLITDTGLNNPGGV